MPVVDGTDEDSLNDNEDRRIHDYNGNPYNGIGDCIFQRFFNNVALLYAEAIPKTLWTFIELVILFEAVMMFCILIFVHVFFSTSRTTCLEQIIKIWPRDGILRVEIGENCGVSNPVFFEYSRDKKKMEDDAILSNENMLHKNDFVYTEQLSSANWMENPSVVEDRHSTYGNLINKSVSGNQTNLESMCNLSRVSYRIIETNNIQTNKKYINHFTKIGRKQQPSQLSKQRKVLLRTLPMTKPNSTVKYKREYETVNVIDQLSPWIRWPLVTFMSNVKRLFMVGCLKRKYAIEYSLENSYLGLSTTTRKHLNIPILIVTLDPIRDPCFGGSFSRSVLAMLVGYDNVIMSSLKMIAVSEGKKGFIRNVVTEKQYEFVITWEYRIVSLSSALIVAFVFMLVFTVSISMIFRYFHHQIFLFAMDIIDTLDFGVRVNIQLIFSSLLIVFIALIGLETIMDGFFDDSLITMSILMTVIVANMFDSICCHHAMTRKYWLRFFYLYHYSFYAYYHRFNGQYSGLALLTTLLFTHHSMLYFFHRFELPLIVQEHMNRIRLPHS